MTEFTDRRFVLAGLASLPVLGRPALAADENSETTETSETSESAETPQTEQSIGFVEEFSLGAEDAPLTVIEYISYSCGACGSFHDHVWPDVKKNYVDTGKVKFVLRAFLRNQADLYADMAARCGGERGYYPMTDMFLSTQSTWTRADDHLAAIRKIGRKVGLSSGQLDACYAELPTCFAADGADALTCLKANPFAYALFNKFQAEADEHEVNSTPTFIIDGDKHTGVMPYDEFSKLLDEKLG